MVFSRIQIFRAFALGFTLVFGCASMAYAQNLLIGVFEEAEHQMGCDHVFTFRLCPNCTQYADDVASDGDIIALKKESWTEKTALYAKAGTDCGMEDGEEKVVLWSDCCSPIGTDELLEHLDLKKGDLCAIEFGNVLLMSKADFNLQDLEMVSLRKLSRKEGLSFFLLPEEDYSDW